MATGNTRGSIANRKGIEGFRPADLHESDADKIIPSTEFIGCLLFSQFPFLQHAAMLCAVLVIAFLSVCPSVCLSVCLGGAYIGIIRCTLARI